MYVGGIFCHYFNIIQLSRFLITNCSHKLYFFSVVFPASSSPQRSIDQRSTTSAASGPIGIVTVVNGESNSLASAPYPPDCLVSQNESEEDENLNPTEKLQ